MSLVPLLGSLGASLGASKAPLSSNLVPLSLQVDVNLPLLAKICTLISQLSSKFGANLPSKLNFHDFLILRTLIFAIPYSVFHGFSIFQQIESKMLSKLQNPPQHALRCVQNAPKRLPKGLQEASKRSQEHPKRPQGLPREPQDR